MSGPGWVVAACPCPSKAPQMLRTAGQAPCVAAISLPWGSCSGSGQVTVQRCQPMVLDANSMLMKIPSLGCDKVQDSSTCMAMKTAWGHHPELTCFAVERNLQHLSSVKPTAQRKLKGCSPSTRAAGLYRHTSLPHPGPWLVHPHANRDSRSL